MLNPEEQARLQQDFQQHSHLAFQTALTPMQHLAQAEKCIDDLVTISNQMRGSLAEVGNFAIFFDMNSIIKEGVIDIAKLDQQYMLTIGRQLITDYQLFTSQANDLNKLITDIHTRFQSIKQAPTVDDLGDVITLATYVQTQYAEWGSAFSRILVNAMHDIANHLNPLRPADRQIVVNL